MGSISKSYGGRVTASARYAVATAETGSFTRAAAKCGVSQPALSAAIAGLEHDLATHLFARSSRGATPTASCLVLLPLLEQLIDAADAVDAAVARERAVRPLRVGVSSLAEPAIVARLFDQVRRADPGRDLVLSEGDREVLLDRLLAGDLSLVVVPRSRIEPNLRRRRLYFDPLVVVGDPSERPDVTIADIAPRPVVLVGEACGLTAFTRAAFAEAGAELRPYSGEAHSYAMMQEWAALGMGSAILPLGKLADGVSASRLIQDGAVVRLPFDALWVDSDPDSTMMDAVTSAIATR